MIKDNDKECSGIFQKNCQSRSQIWCYLIYLFYTPRVLRRSCKWQSARWRATARYYFPTDPTVGRETRKPLRKRRSLGILRRAVQAGDHKRSYVCTSEHRAGHRVFVPSRQWEQRDVIAEIGPWGVSLSISIVRRRCRARGTAITRLVSSQGGAGCLIEPPRSPMSNVTSRCGMAVGQLIIDGLLTRRRRRWQRRNRAGATRGSIYVSPSIPITGYAAANIESRRGLIKPIIDLAETRTSAR